MTIAYLPPIDKPEAYYTLGVLRLDPEKSEGPRFEQFRVPYVRSMTVIQALEWLWDQGSYIAFRANCREFTCGSCCMLVNGKPRLACDTPFEDRMRLEPLTRYRVLKDLVVDNSSTREKWRELELWPHNRQGKVENVPEKTLEHYANVYSRCIECYACLEACPASDSEDSRFCGPMWMLQIARAQEHPLDGMDRLAQASNQGLALCVNCYECADVCPMELSPVSQVNHLRMKALKEKFGFVFRGLR